MSAQISELLPALIALKVYPPAGGGGGGFVMDKYFNAYVNAGGATLADGVESTVIFDETFGNQGNVYDIVSGRYEPGQGGIYQLSVRIMSEFTAGATNVDIFVVFRVAGVEDFRIQIGQFVGGNVPEMHNWGGTVEFFDETYTAEIVVLASFASGTGTIFGFSNPQNCVFSGYRLADTPV